MVPAVSYTTLIQYACFSTCYDSIQAMWSIYIVTVHVEVRSWTKDT